MDTDNGSLHKKSNKIHPMVIDETGSLSIAVDKSEAKIERQSWGGKLDFILSALSYSVGLGAVWRFPYLCYKNGGGAFLIPFFIFMILVGVPIMYLELAVGQFTSRGPILSWVMTPLFKGVGISMNWINNYVNIYYIMLLGYSLYYFVLSLNSSLPWEKCNSSWGSINCVDNFDSSVFNYTKCTGIDEMKCSNGQCYIQEIIDGINATCDTPNITSIGYHDPIYPSQDFWNLKVLKKSPTIEETGTLVWELVVALAVSWVICFFCLFRGVKLSGKIVYFTAIFPYVVMLILGIKGWTLDGADIGIEYFIYPKVEKLMDPIVWKDAAVQVFFTLSLSYGGLIALSSYNEFENNILRDTVILSISNFLTCLLAGFVVFAYMGNLSFMTGLPMELVVQEGPGLVYVVYPYAATKLAAPPVWSCMFFIMMLCLGMGTMMASVETLTTSLEDYFPVLKETNKIKAITLAIICVVFFIIGLLLCSQTGTYWVGMLDDYAAGWALFLIGFVECISVGWFYGTDRFEKDLSVMFGNQKKVNSTLFILWKICWQFVTPGLLLIMTIMTWAYSEPLKFGSYVLPVWTMIVGEILCFTSLIGILAWMGFEFYRAHKTGKSFRSLIQPDKMWRPAADYHQALVEKAHMNYETQSISKKLKNLF